jgi:hypothetical protein
MLAASFKPVAFNPYGSRRKPRRVPRWLILLLIGLGAGVAGVLFVQQRYLPPRLSAAETASLRSSFERAESERQRLSKDLQETARQLHVALADKKALAEELAASRQSVDRLRESVGALAAALPPDPRGGVVQVRAAKFSVESGKLAYDAVLSRDRASSRPLPGVIQMLVSGSKRGGTTSTVKLQPVAVQVGNVESVRGALPLPEGFDPQQVTLQVLDKPDGRQLGMRVLNVK